MRKVIFLGVLIIVFAGLSSCNNSSSDPNNSSAQHAFDSLSEAGDTVTRHATTFSTAVHQLTNDLNQIPITGNADRDFAVLLKSIHQGSVDLAQAQLRTGKDNTLKKMAQSIAGIRKTEITTLENFVDSVKKGPLRVSLTKKDEDTGFNRIIKTHKAMMWDMSKMDTNMVADQQFVAVMIPHLQSAVYLAEGFLKYGKDAWLTQQAKDMIPLKMKQIEELKQWANKTKKAP